MLALATIPFREGDGLERGEHVTSSGEARGGILLERSVQHFGEGGGHVVARLADVRRGSEEMVLHHAGDSVGVERHGAAQHLEADDAEGILVTLRAGASAGALLGTHERRRADHRSVGGEVHVRRAQRDPEVRYQDAALVVDQDVATLDVAVDDMAVVGVGERASGAAQHLQRDGHRQGPLGVDHQAERAAFDELHGDKENPAQLPDAVHGDNVGMIELGHHARFALEPLGDFDAEPELRR